MENYGKKYYFKYWVIYTILFAVTSAGVFFVFWEEGKSFCWLTDAVSQYVPKVYYFIREAREFFSELLKGNFSYQFYDFSLGLGDSTPLHMEPVYWLFALFQPKNVETAYTVIMILRYYLAGLSMSVFLLYFHTEGWASILGSLAYIYSGFGLYAGMKHNHFLAPMILFPLLILGMEEIYRKKRWYLCTIFVAVSLWCGYYFTYMSTFGMGVYFLIRFFTGKEEKSIKAFLLRMRTIICSYLLGIAIGNITFFNTFANFLESARTFSNEAYQVPFTYGKSWLYECFKSFLVAGRTPGNWMHFGFIAFAFFAVIILFVRKGRKEWKAAFVTGSICCVIPMIAYVLSGFDRANNRWCYMYAFVISAILAVMAKELFTLSKKELILLLIASVPYLYIGIVKKLLGFEVDNSIFGMSVLVLLAYLFLLAANLWKRGSVKVKRGCMTALTIGMLMMSGVFIFAPSFGNLVAEFPEKGKVVKLIKNTPLKAVKNTTGKDNFYRVSTGKNKNASQNASMLLRYNGLNYYTSTQLKGTADFYRTLGLTTWNKVRIEGFDDRGFLDILANVKYYCMNEKAVYDLPYGYTKSSEKQVGSKVYEIFKNQYRLPFGYTYDQTISFEELEEYPVCERQEVLMQAAVLDSKEGKDTGENIQITGKLADILDMELSEGIELTGDHLYAPGGSEITIQFKGEDEAETYLWLSGLSTDTRGKTNLEIVSGDTAIKYTYYSDKSTYKADQDEYIFNLGYKEEAENKVTIRFLQTLDADFDSISIYVQPMYATQEYTSKLKENALENVTFGRDSFSGEVDLEDEKLMVFSIPYQNGWTAYVDGEKTEIEKVNMMYSGLSLSEGHHVIEMRYHMPGLKISLIISASGIMILVIALMIRRKKKNAA
ncbi:MAG: YfhO family protein [Muricoprocola sp.]